MPNKEQTEQLINLGFSGILLILSLLSVYAFFSGIYSDLFGHNFILILVLGAATFFAMVFGVVFTVTSVYGVNESRND